MPDILREHGVDIKLGPEDDDGPARTLARDTGVVVTGSIGVLVRAVENGRLSEATADRWLKRRVDEMDFCAPSRDFSDYCQR